MSCQEISAKMACDVRRRLLQREAAQNIGMYSVYHNTQSCNGMSDLDAERKGNMLSKNLCFDPASYVKTGAWEKAYEAPEGRSIPVVFNFNSRRY